MSRMKKNSIAFFNSNDVYPVSADSTLPFEQHRDIFYLSGVDQEESVLMLCPNASDINLREVLFLKETSKFNTDQLYYDRGQEWLFTNFDFRYVSSDKDIFGKGFDSDKSFEKIKFLEVNGYVSLDE